MHDADDSKASPNMEALEHKAIGHLDAGETISAEDLAKLIRDINPTPILGLDEKRKRGLYTLKVRLQGLLIRTFPERVRLRRDPDTDDLAFLRIGPGPEHDAKHVVLSRLTEDERNLALARMDDS